MNENHYDEVMARAMGLSEASRRCDIVHVRFDLQKVVAGLQAAVVSNLVDRGILTAEERTRASADLADDAITPSERQFRLHGPSAEELAERVARGEVEARDERVALISPFAVMLHQAAGEVRRLSELQSEVEKRLLKSVDFVRTLTGDEYYARQLLWEWQLGHVTVTFRDRSERSSAFGPVETGWEYEIRRSDPAGRFAGMKVLSRGTGYSPWNLAEIRRLIAFYLDTESGTGD